MKWMSKQSHYPSFDVMNEQDEWDDHTQTVVTSRLKPRRSYQFLTDGEAETIRRICSILVNDEKAEVLDFVIDHIDQTLYQSTGEGQRKTGVPKAPELIRGGLKAIEASARSKSGSSFLELNTSDQKDLLGNISVGKSEPQGNWSNIPQTEWFKKLLNLTIESYCSHPSVWSAIGYAGPAYPRGYVRTQLGQLDPWEAKPEQ